MSLDTVLDTLGTQLNGERATNDEIAEMRQKLSSELVPPWFATMITTYPLAGVCFSLDEDEDESELGAEFRWPTPAQIVEEAAAYYPGISVLKLGYVPIGQCLVGSGDPYFINMKINSSDPPLLRVYHDLVEEDDSYPEDEIATVCPSLSAFFSKASVLDTC
jgi:hypothetical protein